MSNFNVPVIRIRSIEPIENADAIELAVVGDYRSVVRKGEFKAGQLAVYIPEAALVPQWLLERMNLVGKLAGADKNRVKAIKLRGCLSQGLIYPIRQVGNDNTMLDYMNLTSSEMTSLRVNEGDDVQTFLGITKHEPVIPASFAGEVYNAGTELSVNYDIENIKRYPDVFQEGEEVVMTEKLHGTFCGVGILPEQLADDRHFMRRFVVFSKGLGAQGLCFRDVENNEKNVYIRALKKIGVFEKLLKHQCDHQTPMFLLGEVFGKTVQDLEYGVDLDYRVFDVAVGYRSNLRYFNWGEFELVTSALGLKTVPLIYRGPFYKAELKGHTLGRETLSGRQLNIREGVVIKPVIERYDPELRRVILKSVSEEYLLRKGNVTEYN